MRNQLTQLGFHVPERSYIFDPKKAAAKENVPPASRRTHDYGKIMSLSSFATAGTCLAIESPRRGWLTSDSGQRT